MSTKSESSSSSSEQVHTSRRISVPPFVCPVIHPIPPHNLPVRLTTVSLSVCLSPCFRRHVWTITNTHTHTQSESRPDDSQCVPVLVLRWQEQRTLTTSLIDCPNHASWRFNKCNHLHGDHIAVKMAVKNSQLCHGVNKPTSICSYFSFFFAG